MACWVEYYEPLSGAWVPCSAKVSRDKANSLKNDAEAYESSLPPEQRRRYRINSD